MKNKKILIVIPARGGSRGVPKKNIKMLGGKPLMCNVIDAALNAQLADRVILSTDDSEIAAIAKKLGVEVPFVRPPEIATDSTTLLLVIKHAMKYFDDQGWCADGVMSLQPNSPFTSTATIDKAIEMFHQQGVDSVVTISEITQGHPYVAKRMVDGNMLENYFAVPSDAILFPRQKRPAAYYYTGAMFLRTRKVIDSWNGTGYGLGRDCRGIVVGPREAVSIDSMSDFEYAQFLIEKGM